MKKKYKNQNILMLKTLHESAMKDLLQQVNIDDEDFNNICENYKPFINFESLPYVICQVQISEKTKLMRENFVVFHRERATSIPVFYFVINQNMYFAFESYDFDYKKIDIVFEYDKTYKRQIFNSLQELFANLREKLEFNTTIQLLDENSFVNFLENAKNEVQVVDFFAQNIMQYVKDNLSDPELSLKKIAESVLYMNVDYVSKKFVKGAGQKFSAFLANERINCAKVMLSTTNCSVQSVAHAVGCQNSPDYFSKLFKKHTGLTPTDYMKNKMH